MGSRGLLLLKLASSLLLAAYTVAVARQPLPARCERNCGNVEIPYPFGTKKGCFKDSDFQINCNSSSGHQIPYLARANNTQVVSIYGNTSEIHVSMPVSQTCYNPKRDNYTLSSITQERFLVPPKFSISSEKNNFNAVGPESFAYIYDRKGRRIHGCESNCGDQSRSVTNYSGNCSGDGYCQNDFEQALTNYSITVSIFLDSPDVAEDHPCSYAFLARSGSFNFSDDHDINKLKESKRSEVVLDWAVDRTRSCGGACKGNKTECRESESVGGHYYCTCKKGFQGNPYMDDGCKDVDECLTGTSNCLHPKLCHNTEGDYKCFCPHGQRGNGRNEAGPGSGCGTVGRIMTIPLVVTIALLVAFTLVSTLCWAQKQRTVKKLRMRNFEQNGGNLLLQQLSQQQGYTDRTRIFTKDELKNATNNFDESRILGRGGQGTVYKGILTDNTVVAIKKSRVGGDPQNIKSFINEVLVLSQINHRHVVKLLGCCLETEVPLLVYEFVDNGTLLDHLDPLKNEFSITWETRLRVATETAEAISYLHSEASIPIIHRDIKSANILLDHNDRAKVSDFGASRLIHLDEAQVATVVQGTIGYLDPEYLQTGQLNEKSDVYSFGIVLVELLTGNKAFQFHTLAKHFVSSMNEDRLWEILDKRVLDQKNTKQLMEAALLAKRCIKVNGEERPTMKEVAMELEGLIAMEKHLHEKDNNMMVEESEYLQGHCHNNDGFGSTSASFSVASSHDSIQKHVTFDIIDGGR